MQTLGELERDLAVALLSVIELVPRQILCV
jgi:hypothetical protein